MTTVDLLESLSRDELIARAKALGAERPELMTRVELRDEIVRLSEPDELRRQQSRGWFGVARDLVASVVEAGLHMPDAAAVIRGEARLDANLKARPPVATVTLAEIYASQGHADRAMRMLDEVLAKEPEHEMARALADRLRADSSSQRRRAAHASDAVEHTPASPEPAPTLEPLDVVIEPAAAAADVSVGADEPMEEPVPSDMRRGPPIEHDSLTMIVGSDQLYVYWELTDESVERARTGQGEGQIVVRIARFIPGPQGAEHRDEDIPVGSSSGFAVLPKGDENTVVRAALGFSHASGFVPLSVAVELDTHFGDESRLRVRWAPPHENLRAVEPAHRRALDSYRSQNGAA